MSNQNVIKICCGCQHQHITAVKGDPSQELMTLVQAHLASRKGSPELDKALTDEGFSLSHGLCLEAYNAAAAKLPSDSGMGTLAVNRMLQLRQAMADQVDQSQEGAAQFHQKVSDLIGGGAKPSEVIKMLERIRDSYPENDHHKDIAQSEINWINSVAADIGIPVESKN